MTVRTVTVHLKAKFSDYLNTSEAAKQRTRELRREVEQLDRVGKGLTRGGLYAGLASIPSLAAPAGAALAALPAFAFSGAAAITTMAVATRGLTDAFKAAADGDGDKFAESMAKLSVEAQDFVNAYLQVKPVLTELRKETQDPLFDGWDTSLRQLTEAYLPTLLREMPQLAGALGATGREFATWASQPQRVAQVGRQFALATDLVDDFSDILRTGTGILLDLADAGADFARTTTGGMVRGTEAFQRWLDTARGTGQLNDLFESGKRILSALTEVAAEAGDMLFDAMANPALADGAETLIDITGLLLQVVHGLINAFELLPAGMQSTVAMAVAVGAAVMILAGRVIALKASLESMKASAISSGIALKSVGSFMAGPWGIAITVATLALGAFAAGNADAQSKASELRETLDEQTGAFTDSTRAMVVNRLEQEGVLRAAKNMGLDLKLVTDAAMGSKDAMWTLNNQLNAMSGLHNVEKIQDGVGGMNDALAETQAQAARARESMDKTGSATDSATGKYRDQTDAVKELSATLRAQTDPMFAMIKAQKDAATAQADYTKAVKEHGPKSQEAIAANLKLAENAVILKDAVTAAAAAFDGRLSPELEAAMRAAGATDTQIAAMKKSLQDAKTAADKFEGTYSAQVDIKQASLDAALAKILRLRELSRKMGFSINAYDPEGMVRNKRWGGVTTHARMGTLRDAQVYDPVSSGARYAFAEPATGGEAFVPRFGDYGRSMSILGTAAGWYGARVVDGQQAGASAPVVQVSARVYLGTRDITDMVRVEVEHLDRANARRADMMARSGRS